MAPVLVPVGITWGSLGRLRAGVLGIGVVGGSLWNLWILCGDLWASLASLFFVFGSKPGEKSCSVLDLFLKSCREVDLLEGQMRVKV